MGVFRSRRIVVLLGRKRRLGTYGIVNYRYEIIALIVLDHTSDLPLSRVKKKDIIIIGV